MSEPIDRQRLAPDAPTRGDRHETERETKQAGKKGRVSVEDLRWAREAEGAE